MVVHIIWMIILGLVVGRLIAAGCDVVTVRRAPGHSDASITLTIYSHLWPDLWPDANDRTRKAAAGLVDQSLGPTADALRAESNK